MDMELLPSNNMEKTIENLVGFRGTIYFGVPKETASFRLGSKRKGKSADNASILAIMEAGSPVKNIPSRKLLGPVVNKHIEQIKEMFNKIYDAIIRGEEQEADLQMNILAQRVEMWTKAYFREDNDWAPNAPATIKRKGSDTPLIDTGALRQSIRAFYVKE